MTVSIFNPITSISANPPMKTRVVYMDRPIVTMAKDLFDAKSFKCFMAITKNESHMNALAVNPDSKAEGIAQLLPSTMKSLGLRHTTSANVQILGFVAYVSRHYGSVCGAWKYWQKHYNY